MPKRLAVITIFSDCKEASLFNICCKALASKSFLKNEKYERLTNAFISSFPGMDLNVIGYFSMRVDIIYTSNFLLVDWHVLPIYFFSIFRHLFLCFHHIGYDWTGCLVRKSFILLSVVYPKISTTSTVRDIYYSVGCTVWQPENNRSAFAKREITWTFLITFLCLISY